MPGIKQLGSTRSRKISSHSLQADAKLVEEEGGTATFEDAESVTMLSDETQESPVERDQEVEDEHLCDSLPWIKVSKGLRCPFALSFLITKIYRCVEIGHCRVSWTR